MEKIILPNKQKKILEHMITFEKLSQVKVMITQLDAY